MKENRSVFLIFSVLFGSIMLLFLTTETFNEPIPLPSSRIDYRTEESDVGIEILDIFEMETVVEFASEMFDYKGIRSGVVAVETTGFSKEDLGVESSAVTFTEVQLDDGTIVSFIEPESEVVDMYNKISTDGLIVVIVEDLEGKRTIIKPEDEFFEEYRKVLLKEKRSIQTTKLTNLEMLLSEAVPVGGYDAFLVNSSNEYTKIRTSKVYFNKKKNYMLMLSKNRQGVEFFLVDAGVDLYFDHIYEFSSEFLEVKGFVTADDLEHLMYRAFMAMTEKNLERYETTFKGDRLIIYNHLE